MESQQTENEFTYLQDYELSEEEIESTHPDDLMYLLTDQTSFFGEDVVEDILPVPFDDQDCYLDREEYNSFNKASDVNWRDVNVKEITPKPSSPLTHVKKKHGSWRRKKFFISERDYLYYAKKTMKKKSPCLISFN